MALKRVSDGICAERLKVIADPTRLKVLRQLVDGAKSVGEINEALRLPQNLLSHHLKVLREADLLTAKRIGKQIHYSITRSVETDQDLETIDLGCCRVQFG